MSFMITTTIIRTLAENSFLSGTLPTQIGLLTQILSINMINNDLLGTIPSELENLYDLKGLVE